jgi:hypothetical protein
MKEHKMKQLILICAILMLGLVNVSVAQDIDGKWMGRMPGREGDFDILFTFKVNADTLTGEVEGPMGNIPISHGKVNGNKFSFDVMFGRTAIDHRCALVADSISMKYVGMEGHEREIILRRAEKAKE